MKKNKNLKVAIVMGSQSDFKTMKLSANILKKMGVQLETKIISAFGDTSVASTSSYNDVAGTEVSFSRTFADSKILGLLIIFKFNIY